ncbi:flagellin lysine-N-methylase [Marinospirillum insulare]|uniref:Lysine-N-methylase n=1 Tax=Marinospirillum insulare TaxID=217169 RepID=A0ABQ5ZYT9_9GAMM|nr:flagellin lysine-N-methylase [Marinospirillum insulare]GLR64243.1 hypothetical protein GCM10007878_16810 [Marinospirillum insulare]
MQRDALAPRYVRNFSCTGSKCPDNCCHTWQVAIDAETYRGYRTNPAVIPLVEDKIAENHDLTTKDITPGFFKMDPKTNRCSLQDTSGLCQLVKNFGPNALCQTCTTYPRSIQQLGDDLLITLSDSCPVAAKSLITQPDALELDFAPVAIPPNPLATSVDAPNAFNARYQLLQGLLTLLRHREQSLEMRLFICGLLIQKIQPLFDKSPTDQLEEKLEETLGLFYSLVNEGYFEEQAKALNKKSDGSLGLVILGTLRREKKQNNAAFNEELSRALKGLNITDKTQLDISHLNQLDKARKKYLTNFEKKHPHSLENLLVNWLLGSLFPIKNTNLMDGWTNLMARYLLLRTLLSAIGAEQKKLGSL